MSLKFQIILLAGFLMVPSLALARQGSGAMARQQTAERQTHRQEQRAENKMFRESLSGKTAEEKAAAIKTQRETQAAENQAFNTKLHEERMTALKSRLANNTKLTDAQKTELINQFENQYQENVAYSAQNQAANMAFFDQIAGDTTMTQAQKKAAIKAHFQEQKAAAKTWREQQRTENKSALQKIRSQVQGQE